MGIYDLIESNAVTIQNELPNKDLLYISFEKNIPPVHRGVHIAVSFDTMGNIKVDDSSKQIPDPSTVYVHLPIKEGYAESLPYWPHYIEMTPQQRYKYLCWLSDVELPIDMGYVFIYYYGLERQMLSGNFDRAFDEIIKLRNAHSNKSFQKYSENALIHSAIMTGRIDRLVDLHEKTDISGYNNANFLIAYNENLTLGVDNLMLVFRKKFSTARNAEKENPELMRECIEESYPCISTNGFSISQYDISKVKNTIETRFANYSFPPEIQKVEITDFYSCKLLMNNIELLFNSSYLLYKEKKKLFRTGKTPEEIAIGLREKNVKRYKKLFKEKLITQKEYDILISKI